MSATDSIRPASHEARGCDGRRRLSAAWNRLALAVFLAALLAPLASPSAAGAGPSRYVFEQCDSVLPGGGTAGVIAGQHPRFGFGLENSCAQPGGALVVRQPEMPAADGGSASWGIPISAPAGTELESVAITAASCAGPPSHAEVFTSGWPPVLCADDVRVFPIGPSYRGFSISLSCVDFGGGPCQTGPWVAAHYFATTIVDRSPPRLSEPEGSLLGGGVNRGRQALRAGAYDLGGGLSTIWPSVNGIAAVPAQHGGCQVRFADNPSATGTVATEVSPCPPTLEGDWRLDTSGYPFRDGANSVSVCAADFATLGDPNTSCTPPRTVQVDNSCIESAVAGGAALSAEFSSSHAEQATVGFGKGAEVIGALSNVAGDPIPGATLCVKVAIEPEAQPKVVGSVRTDSSGHYRLAVDAGPNREFVIGYRYDTVQVARSVRYYAHAHPSLRANRDELVNGERVRFRGRLPGPRAGGRVVVLQAGTAGSKRWITFRRATADAQGAFRAGYRFRTTMRRTRYRFRAVVPRQAGYPWVEGHSKAVEVLVKP